MDIKKERERVLKGIEEEIEKLEKNKEQYPDFDNRMRELKKEAEELRKEIEPTRLNSS